MSKGVMVTELMARLSAPLACRAGVYFPFVDPRLAFSEKIHV
jgi:hypothetical protein